MNKGVYIIVEGDFNDGDHVSKRTDVSELSKEKIKEIKDKLERFDPEKEFDSEIMDYLPYMDNMDIQTVTSVEIVRIEHLSIDDLN